MVLDARLSLIFAKGFPILLLDIIPQPTPKVTSRLLILFEPTINSEEKTPVPAKSLAPTEISGIYADSVKSLNLTSKPLSLYVWSPLKLGELL